jgi:hypothetical protein
MVERAEWPLGRGSALRFRRLRPRTSALAVHIPAEDLMANRKQKMTTAKRSRENRLRERRVEKQARKDARKLAAAHEAERADSRRRESV